MTPADRTRTDAADQAEDLETTEDSYTQMHRSVTARLNAYARVINSARMSDLSGPLSDTLDSVAAAIRRIAEADARPDPR